MRYDEPRFAREGDSKVWINGRLFMLPAPVAEEIHRLRVTVEAYESQTEAAKCSDDDGK